MSLYSILIPGYSALKSLISGSAALESVHHCPIHGGWLEVLCPFCGEPTPYRLNAHLLSVPFRCGNCRTFYCAQAPYFVKREALTSDFYATELRC